jgi:hypothetical protein
MTIFAPPPMTPCPIPREWYLVRDKFMPPRNGREGFTLGEIRYGFHDAQRICHTCEDDDKHLEDGNGKSEGAAIPCGRYRLTLPMHGRNILVNAVPGFEHVEICAEGHRERLDGYIAVGDARTLDGCGNCQPALVRLITELRRKTMNGIAVYLNVVRWI